MSTLSFEGTNSEDVGEVDWAQVYKRRTVTEKEPSARFMPALNQLGTRFHSALVSCGLARNPPRRNRQPLNLAVEVLEVRDSADIL